MNVICPAAENFHFNVFLDFPLVSFLLYYAASKKIYYNIRSMLLNNCSFVLLQMKHE